MSIRICIIGAGPGAAEYFTLAGRLAAQECGVVIGSQRLLGLVPEHPRRVVAGPGIEMTFAAIASAADQPQVAVLVSGDPGLFSLARLVVARFGRGACEVIPGVSALQVGFARVALDWSDARIIGAHASVPSCAPQSLVRQEKLAILLGCAAAADWLADVARALAASHTFVACSNLTAADERVAPVPARDAHVLASSGKTILLALGKDLWP